MVITYEQEGPKLSETDIKAAEKKMGREIPKQYRQFLLEHNSGSPTPSNFKQGDKIRGIAFFFGLNVTNGVSLEFHLETFKDRIPRGYFPIARDSGGNLILLADSGSNKGKIYFWDSDYEAEEGQSPAHNNIGLVADSFEELLASLK